MKPSFSAIYLHKTPYTYRCTFTFMHLYISNLILLGTVCVCCSPLVRWSCVSLADNSLSPKFMVSWWHNQKSFYHCWTSFYRVVLGYKRSTRAQGFSPNQSRLFTLLCRRWCNKWETTVVYNTTTFCTTCCENLEECCFVIPTVCNPMQGVWMLHSAA